MKSIRRTLVLNVLVLLVVTLGVVTYVVYHTAAGALRERQQAATELARRPLPGPAGRGPAGPGRQAGLRGPVELQPHQPPQPVGGRRAGRPGPADRPGLPGRARPDRDPVRRHERPVPGSSSSARLATELKLNEDEIYQRPGQRGRRPRVRPDHQRRRGRLEDPVADRPDRSRSIRPPCRAHPRTTRPGSTPWSCRPAVRVRSVTIKARVARFTQAGSFWLQRPRADDSVSAVAGRGRAGRGRPRRPARAPARRPGPPVLPGPRHGPGRLHPVRLGHLPGQPAARGVPPDARRAGGRRRRPDRAEHQRPPADSRVGRRRGPRCHPHRRVGPGRPRPVPAQAAVVRRQRDQPEGLQAADRPDHPAGRGQPGRPPPVAGPRTAPGGVRAARSAAPPTSPTSCGPRWPP